MANSRPADVEVVGLDLFPPIEREGMSAPEGRNWRFVYGVDFEREDWGPEVEVGGFDVVRGAFLAGCVADWPSLLGRVRR